MSAGEHDLVTDDELHAADGRRWVRARPRWLGGRDVARWVRRGGPVAVHGPADGRVDWWTSEQAAAWWATSRACLEVPGTSAAGRTDDDGRTYGAFVWRSGRDRVLGLQVFC